MKRRQFLKYASALGTGALLAPRMLFAAPGDYSGPLWLTIEAGGGWDPTSFCDPKGYLDVGDNARINNYPANTIGNINGSPIRYAPPPDSFLDTANQYFQNKTFFEKHYQNLMVINGLDTKTVSHSDGRRTTWTGNSGPVAYPNLGGMIAAILAPNQSLPFIANGGTANGAGLITPVKLSSGRDTVLNETAFPNRPVVSNTSRRYIPDEAYALMRQFNRERSTGLPQTQQLARIRASMEKFAASRNTDNTLGDVIDYMSAHPGRASATFQLDPAGTARTRAYRLYEFGRLAIAAHQTGSCAAAHYQMSGFDTHDNHDARHYPLLMDLLQGVDAIIDEAKAQGVTNDIVVIVGSDFGRTNAYNDRNGKHHWPITSMLFYAEGRIQGNRVIGATDASFKRMHLDANDISKTVATDQGIRLTPEHIHRAIRQLAGIGAAPEATTRFPLQAEILPLFG